MQVIVPINFTHNADIDGIGCAVLSSLAFNRYTSFDNSMFFANPFIIPMDAKQESMKKFVDEFNCENSIKKHVSDAFFDLYGDYKYSIPSNIADIISKDELCFIIIISDIYMPDNFWGYFTYALNKLFDFKSTTLVWQFDHHSTNPNYISDSSKNFSIIYNYDNDHLTSFNHTKLPTIVKICGNYFTNLDSGLNKINLVEKLDYVNKDQMKNNYYHRKSILMSYHLSDKCKAERSATYIYFKFLFSLGLFSKMDIDIFENLCKLVYHISNYDTFEFDKPVPNIPIEVEYPDALTIIWKSLYNDFFKMHKTILDSLQMPKDEKYSMIPIMPWASIKLDYLYEDRSQRYKNDVRSIRCLSFKDFKTILNIEYEGLKDDDIIAVIPKEVTDASFTGNQILKEYPFIKIVAMMYSNSGIISFRSSNKFDDSPDVGYIAKQLNGGGHKYAAGITIPNKIFLNLLEKCWEIKSGIENK